MGVFDAWEAFHWAPPPPCSLSLGCGRTGPPLRWRGDNGRVCICHQRLNRKNRRARQTRRPRDPTELKRARVPP